MYDSQSHRSFLLNVNERDAHSVPYELESGFLRIPGISKAWGFRLQNPDSGSGNFTPNFHCNLQKHRIVSYLSVSPAIYYITF